MNPFSTAPLFLALTANLDSAKRKREARWACIYAFGILVLFLLLGSAIIEFFGISIAGIRAAGGLIISVIGFGMLFPKANTPGVAPGAAQETDIAFTPLAMPSLAGPGSISVVLTAAAQIESRYPDDYPLIYGGITLGMAVTLMIALAILRASGSLARLLGPSGLDAVTRIFGFLLIAIGMQFLLTGVGDFYGLRHA